MYVEGMSIGTDCSILFLAVGQGKLNPEILIHSNIVGMG